MRSHPAQLGETFDGPPTLERSGSERRGGAVSSLFPEGRALKKVPVFGKTNKKAASYCTSEQFSDGQILNLFCLTQWLR